MIVTTTTNVSTTDPPSPTNINVESSNDVTGKLTLLTACYSANNSCSNH